MSYLDAARIQTVLDDIRFRDWDFVLGVEEGQFYLQCRFAADDKAWSGRKWPLSVHMTRSEIVQTALKAALTAAWLEFQNARDRSDCVGGDAR